MYCNVCGEPASNRCASCKSAWYCCREHQLQDWKSHKNLCKLFTDGVNEGWFDPNGMSSVKKWPNGTIYRGNLMGAKPHGRGVIFYPNGDVCGGVWKHEVNATKIRLGLAPSLNCTHGFNDSSADDGIIKDFIYAWQAAFNVDTSGNQTVAVEDKFQKAHDATITKFYKVWSKLENMELVKKSLFRGGTNYILQGVLRRYCTHDQVASGAAVACYFDQYVDVFLKKTQATINWAKIKKLKCGADEHALVKYFRSHIPCSCLDGIHKELKGVRGETVGDSIGAQLQQLILGDGDNLPSGRNDTKQCLHGFGRAMEMEDILISQEFFSEYMKQIATIDGSVGEDVSQMFSVVSETLHQEQKYQAVFFDLAKMEFVVLGILFEGTHSLLEGNEAGATMLAMVACYFEEWIACAIHKTSSTIDWLKVYLLIKPDKKTLVSFFKTRIPCSCLDEKYKEVRSITKMGICMNPGCSLPEKKVELNDMKHCTRCRRAHYCSRSCQKAHWPMHKEGCKYIETQNAALASNEWLTNQLLSGKLSMGETSNGECVVRWNEDEDDAEENEEIAAQHAILLRNLYAGDDGKEKK